MDHCSFEPDYFAELSASLAEPLDCEIGDPPRRVDKRTRLWGRVMWEDGSRPSHVCGHRSAHHAGHKARTRK